MLNQENQRELLRFLITGLMAVGCDLAAYCLLLETIPVDMAKGLSFITGSVVAFFMNKIWTFRSDAAMHSAAFQFACLYSVTFLANVSVNHITLILFNNMTILGFLAATGTSTVLNFIGMKFWVFKSIPHTDKQG